MLDDMFLVHLVVANEKACVHGVMFMFFVVFSVTLIKAALVFNAVESCCC